MRVKVIRGFSDKETSKNYQDNDIIDITDKRYEELKDKFVEEYVEPVKEVDNSELFKEIEELKAENEELKAENEELKAKIDKLNKEPKEQSKNGENNGKVQK